MSHPTRRQPRTVYLNSAQLALSKNKAVPLSKAKETLTKYRALFEKIGSGEGTIRDMQHFINLIELGAILSLRYNIHSAYYPHFQSAYEALDKNIVLCGERKKVVWHYEAYSEVDRVINLYFKQLYLTSYGELEAAIELKNKNFRATPMKLYCKGDFGNEYISTANKG